MSTNHNRKKSWWLWWLWGSSNSSKVTPNKNVKSLIEKKVSNRNMKANSRLNNLIMRGEMNDDYYNSDAYKILPPQSKNDKGK